VQPQQPGVVGPGIVIVGSVQTHTHAHAQAKSMFTERWVDSNQDLGFRYGK